MEHDGGGDIDWLEAEGFKHVAGWSNPQQKLEWVDRPDKVLGIYAFVVERKICYIGRATYLRSRIRSYNRALAPKTPRAFRQAHCHILETWNDHKIVDVWAYILDLGKDESLGRLESKWINEKRPKWNGTCLDICQEKSQQP